MALLFYEEKNEKIIGAIVLNHEYEECYQNIYWQIYAEDEEVQLFIAFVLLQIIEDVENIY